MIKTILLSLLILPGFAHSKSFELPIWELDPHYVYYRALCIECNIIELKSIIKETEYKDKILHHLDIIESCVIGESIEPKTH